MRNTLKSIAIEVEVHTAKGVERHFAEGTSYHSTLVTAKLMRDQALRQVDVQRVYINPKKLIVDFFRGNP